MTKTQFLLLKLAEECAEVAQRAIKQIQFGKDERQKDRKITLRTVQKQNRSLILNVCMMS